MKLLFALSTLAVACDAASKNAFVVPWQKGYEKESMTSILVIKEALQKLGAESDVVVSMAEEDADVEERFVSQHFTVVHGDTSVILAEYERVQILDYHVVVTANPEHLFETSPESKLVSSEDNLWHMIYPSEHADDSTILSVADMKSAGIVAFPEGVWTNDASSFDASMEGARAWWNVLATPFGGSAKSGGIDFEAMNAPRKLMDYNSSSTGEEEMDYNSSSTGEEEMESSTAEEEMMGSSTAEEMMGSSTAEEMMDYYSSSTGEEEMESSTAEDESPTADESPTVDSFSGASTIVPSLLAAVVVGFAL